MAELTGELGFLFLFLWNALRSKIPANMKKSKALNLTSERRIELLGHYFQIDQEKRLVYVKLRYEKASDMLEDSFGEEGCGMFKNSVLESIAQIYGNIPVEYRAEIELYVGDYEGYDPKVILTRFNEALELNNYQSQRDKKRRWLRASLLVLAGVAILALMGIGVSQHWFGSEGSEKSSILTEILDIAGWVFIWEAVTVCFLQPSAYGVLGVKILSRTSGIRLYKKGESEILAEENGAAIVAKWEEEGKLEKSGKLSLLLSSSAFLAMGFASFFTTLFSLGGYSASDWEFWMMLIGVLIVLTLDILGGIGGLSRYLGRGPLKNFVFVLAAFNIIQLIVTIVGSIQYQTWHFTFSVIATFILQIGYVYGVVIDILKSKKPLKESK